MVATRIPERVIAPSLNAVMLRSAHYVPKDHDGALPTSGSCSGMHVLVDASGAGDAGPTGSKAPPVLNELSTQNEDELRPVVGVDWNRAPGSQRTSCISQSSVVATSLTNTPAANVDGLQGRSSVFTYSWLTGGAACGERRPCRRPNWGRCQGDRGSSNASPARRLGRPGAGPERDR